MGGGYLDLYLQRPKGSLVPHPWMNNTYWFTTISLRHSHWGCTSYTPTLVAPGPTGWCGIIFETKAHSLAFIDANMVPWDDISCVKCLGGGPPSVIDVRIHDCAWLVHRRSINSSSLVAPLRIVNIIPSAYDRSHVCMWMRSVISH